MKAQVLWSMLVIALATSATPVCTTMAKVTKATGKDAARLLPAAQVFPGTVYDNAYQIPGAKGKVNMIQPEGNVDVILAVSADGLSPNSRYIPHFDYTGIEAGNIATAGRWVEAGEFWTDASGHGEWNFTVPAGTFVPGLSTYSIFINRTDVNYTVLISDNVVFAIASP